MSQRILAQRRRLIAEEGSRLWRLGAMCFGRGPMSKRSAGSGSSHGPGRRGPDHGGVRPAGDVALKSQADEPMPTQSSPRRPDGAPEVAGAGRLAVELEVDRAFLDWFELRLEKAAPDPPEEDVLNYLVAWVLAVPSWECSG